MLDRPPPSYEEALEAPEPVVPVAKNDVIPSMPVEQKPAAKLYEVDLNKPVQKPATPVASSNQILQSIAANNAKPAPGPQRQDMDAPQDTTKGCDAVSGCVKDMGTVGAVAGCTITVAPLLLICIGKLFDNDCCGKDNFIVKAFNCSAMLTGCAGATACAATCSTVGLFSSPCVSACGEPECLKVTGEGIRKEFC